MASDYADGIRTRLKRMEDVLAVYDYSGDDEALEAVISDCSALSSHPPTREALMELGRWNIVKASALRLRFQRQGKVDDLDEAQRILQTCISSEEGGRTTLRLRALYGLGLLFLFQYRLDRSADTLERAFTFAQQATHLLAAEPASYNEHLKDLIVVHLKARVLYLCMYSGKGADEIPSLIERLSRIAARLSDADPFKGEVLGNMSALYRAKWVIGGQTHEEDLVNSYLSGHTAMRLPLQARYKYQILGWLSLTCQDRFTHGEPVNYIDEAIQFGERANDLIPNGPSREVERDISLNNVALSYMARFRVHGALEDLDKAVEFHRLAASDERRSGFALSARNLCLSLSYRFEETGRLVDVDEAIRIGTRALDRTPPVPVISVINSHLHLGAALTFRYIRMQEDKDYQSACLHLGASAERCRALPFPVRHLQAGLFGLFSQLHRQHFEIHHDPDDLDLAVQNMQTAFPFAEGQLVYPTYKSDLGELLTIRFQTTSVLQDLEESIKCNKSAVDLAPPTYPDRSTLLCRYACALRLRHQTQGTPGDIIEAVALLEEAIQRSEMVHHPRQALFYSELGHCHAALYGSHHVSDELSSALSCFKRAAEASEGVSLDRLRAAVTGAKLAHTYNRVLDASALLSAAVSLLPRIAWLGHEAQGRQARLKAITSDLTCDAAASALICGDEERAVELLEAGRSILWRSLLSLRLDLSDLETVHPDMAREISTIGQALEHDDISSRDLSDKHAEARSQRRRRLAERWGALIEAVRAISGFESFLKPLTFSELRKGAERGPFVMLNVSQYRSDALIVTADAPVQCIPLTRLHYTTVRQRNYELAQALRVAKDAEGCLFLEQTVVRIARQLWHGGLCDVASALESCRATFKNDYLRVWWIPSGGFSLLPVHCAGPYEQGHLGVPDLFISSYTTTVAALLAARTHRPLPASPSTRVVILGVMQQNTPGEQSLPCAEQEMAVLTSGMFVEPAVLLCDSHATVRAVTRALPNHKWVHFCCHAHSHFLNPLESAFSLYDGRLSLGRLVHMRLDCTEFAFLSACHTAKHVAWLPDESLHLVAGIQVAGCHGVIGTVWGMADKDGPALAREFYGHITRGGRTPAVELAAESLHFAINCLRRRGVPLYRWAAFVHFGV